MKKLILLFILFFACSKSLQAQIILDPTVKKTALLNHSNVEALLMASDKSIEDIQFEQTWKPYDSTFAPKRGIALWLKMSIQNPTSTEQELFLYSPERYVTIYYGEDAAFSILKNGNYQRLNNRSNKDQFYFTRIPFLAEKTSEVYIKFEDNRTSHIVLPATLHNKLGYYEVVKSKNDYDLPARTISLIYLTALISIFIFTLILWIKIRRPLYSIYLAYLFFQIIYAFIIIGYTLSTFANPFLYFPRIGNMLNEAITFTFIGFYIFFIINLLEIKNYDKLLVKILKYLAIFCFIYAVSRFVYDFYFSDIIEVIAIFNIVRFIILPLNFILIFWIIYKARHHPLINYFIIGQAFIFTGAIVAFYISYKGLAQVQDSIFYFNNSANIVFQIGLLLEVLCFSMAIAEHTRLLQKSKESSSLALISQLKENEKLQLNMNQELDKKVTEKTNELIEVYTKIEKDRENQIKLEFTQKLKEMEMLALRSQMNPHFLFNSLNSIKHLIMTGSNDNATHYLDDFSSLLRGILQNSNKETITVEDELEILELYLTLEKSRLGNDLTYSINTKSCESLSQYNIPPLLLQPFVENAIWHGLQSSLKPEKILEIHVDCTNDLIITIQDNGIGRKASAKNKKLHTSMGMKITEERLALFNHSNSSKIILKITDLENVSPKTGTLVTLTYSN